MTLKTDEYKSLEEQLAITVDKLASLKWYQWYKRKIAEGEIAFYELEMYEQLEADERNARYTREKRRYQSIKWSFRRFFEGWDDIMEDYGSNGGMDPIVDIPIKTFGITDISFKETDDNTEMTITLERPGILIGKAGQTINAVTEYVSKHEDKPIKILIIESKLWR
jgi:hypothetical protein